jgi:hypothetical protein
LRPSDGAATKLSILFWSISIGSLAGRSRFADALYSLHVALDVVNSLTAACPSSRQFHNLSFHSAIFIGIYACIRHVTLAG